MKAIETIVDLGSVLLNTQDASSREALQNAADRDFHLLLIMSGLVAIGVIIELFDVVPEFLNWWRSNPRKGIRPLLSLIGLMLVIVGVAGEGLFEGLLGVKDTDLRIFDKQSISENELKTAQANERASNAEKATEDEKLQRLRMEALIAPRRLSMDQQTQLAKGCEQPYKQPTIVKSYAGDAESLILADQIANSLQLAGFQIDRQTGNVGLGRPLVGINVYGPDEDRRTLRCIAAGLRNIGKLDAVINGPRFEGELHTESGGLSMLYENKAEPSGPLARGSQIVIAVGVKPILSQPGSETENK